MSEKILVGQVAIVTGGGGGLGRAFALALAESGAKVAVADLNLAGASTTVAGIAARGGEALALEVDVADAGSVEQMALAVAERWGRIDMLINNAAIYGSIVRKPFFEITLEEWDTLMAVNLKGPWLCARAVFPFMRESGGRIVNITSATFYSGSPLWAHYVAAKGGIIGLTRALAREAGDYGIRVNAIAPGFTLTEASLRLIEDAATYGVNRGAIKRAQQTDDLIGALLFFASPASDFVTGQTLVVDGGRQFN
ncbi:MAG: SDR family oxidoreductase [Proteobacteria bacterium]|nr:SDR family oxidoreductase [Pseudomonadota bacterium]